MASADAPRSEDVEDARKTAYASGLVVVGYALEDLAAAFAREDERADLLAAVRGVEPLLSSPVALEFRVPVLVGAGAFGSRSVTLRFERVPPGYDVEAEQEKLMGLCAGFTAEQKENARRNMQGKMGLLVYTARAAFRTFSAEARDAPGDPLRRLLGGEADGETVRRVLAGEFLVDVEDMTLRATPEGPRYGMVFDI